MKGARQLWLFQHTFSAENDGKLFSTGASTCNFQPRCVVIRLEVCKFLRHVKEGWLGGLTASNGSENVGVGCAQ